MKISEYAVFKCFIEMYLFEILRSDFHFIMRLISIPLYDLASSF